MPLRRLNPAAPPGLTNRQVYFYSPPARDANGRQLPPSPAFQTWALLSALSGAELDKAQQIAQKVTHLALIPYQLGVAENMTIQFADGANTRIFQIAAIEDADEQRWQLKVYCFEINQNAGGAN